MTDKNFQNICIVIPVYNPDQTLITIIDQLMQSGFKHIIVIDDGSGDNPSVFGKVSQFNSVALLSHSVNMGKGAALKTGFRYFLKNLSDKCHGLITVDADGQHSTSSIIRVAIKMHPGKNELILGSRSFSKNIPFRSKFGNVLTKKIFKLFYGIELKDTQTGLRGIPLALIGEYLNISYNRYEFEMECLLIAKRKNYFLRQVEIETIYMQGNQSSHFNPILDSIRIYYVFLRFILLSITCFILDITLFMWSFHIFNNVFAATYLSRTISGYTNFHFNKYSVFKSGDKKRFMIELVSYFILAITVAFTSSLIVDLIAIRLNYHLLTTKIIVDSILFLINFIVQKQVIFSKN